MTHDFFCGMIQSVDVKKKYLTSRILCYRGECNVEEKVEQAYLYDFYGELLNEHQRRIYEDFIFQDLSLGEIASCEGISRQGVHDLIKRCNKLLAGYEAKLHLVKKFLDARQKVEKIHFLIKEFKESQNEALIEEIEQISNRMIEEL